MNSIRYSILILLFFFLNSSCRSKGEEILNPDGTKTVQRQFLKYSDPKSKPLVDLIESLERNSISFSGDFSMKIQTGEKLRESNNLNGKIYFDKLTSKVKIQLMEPFFGLIVSQIISDSENIQIKSSGRDGIHSQKMGDLYLVDPATRKQIIIPYPVIYFSIVQNFSTEFKSQNSQLSPLENRVFVKRGEDEYTYFFYDKGLASLELFSKLKNLKAISMVPENYRKGDNPPLRIITKVTDIYTSQETTLVEIQYKNIRKGILIPESTFNF